MKYDIILLNVNKELNIAVFEISSTNSISEFLNLTGLINYLH